MLPLFDPLRQITLISTAFRLFLACLCGAVIGLERSAKNRPAGFRTHMLVCLGAAISTMTGVYMFTERHLLMDMSRMGAQVITGLGFIGAGTIIVTKKNTVKGLTTAAGIWATSAIGLAFGSGMYVIGVISTLLMYVVQHVLYRYFPHNNISMILNFRIHMNRNDGLTEIMDILTAHRFHPMGETRLVSDGEGKWCLSFDSITHKNPYPGEMIEKIKHLDGVLSVEIL